MKIIPYIITSCWYPTHKADEAADKYLEVLKKFPPSNFPGKLVIPVAVTTTKNGIRNIRIIETKTDDGQALSDAMRMVGEMMAEFRNIEGFEYKTRVWSNVGEAMRNLKKESPES